MRRLLFIALALLCWTALPHAPRAQTALVLSSCGSATYPANTYQALTQDTTGKTCGNEASAFGYGCNLAGSSLNNPVCTTLQTANGASATPSLEVGSATDGFFNLGSHAVGLSTNGIQDWFSDTNNVTVFGTQTVSSAPNSVRPLVQAQSFLAFDYSNDNSPPTINCLKSRSTTVGVFVAVQPLDQMCDIIGYADDGTTINTEPYLQGIFVDPLVTVSTGVVQTDWGLNLMNGASTPTRPAISSQPNAQSLKVDYLQRTFAAGGELEPAGIGIGLDPGFSAAATNLILQSETLGTTWATTSATVGASAHIDPKGGTNAWTITDTSASVVGNAHQALAVANDSGTYCVQSYVNAATSTAVSVAGPAAVFSGGTGLTYGARINRVTGVYAATSSTTVSTSGAIDVASPLGASQVGWYLVWFTATNNSTGNTTLTITLQPDASAATGVGATDFYGVSVVKSTTCPQPYIRTTTAAVAMPAGVGPSSFIAAANGVPSATNLDFTVLGTTDTAVKGLYSGGTDILKLVTKGIDALTINASQQVATAANLTIGTVATGTGSFLCGGASATAVTLEATTCVASDESVKHDIKPIGTDDLWPKLMDKQGVTFTYNDAATPGERMGTYITRHPELGINDWAKDFPALVSTDPDGTRHFDYAGAFGLTLTALQDHERRIEVQQREIYLLLIWCGVLSLVLTFVVVRRRA